MASDVLDAIVIGGGHSGLATSYHLHQGGLRHVVLERGRVGESWHSQRWDTFRLNTPAAWSVLPGMAYPGDDPDAFLHRDEFAGLLAGYVERFGLPVVAQTEVMDVSRSDGRFLVATGNSAYASRWLVVASGGQNRPRIPAFAKAVSARLTQLHTADYRNPDQLPSGAILVVGSAQSGCQIAEDLVEAGRRVYLSTSRVGRIPRCYRGRDSFNWLAESGFLDHTIADLRDPAERYAAQPQTSGTHGGHTVSLPQLHRDGVTLLGSLVAADGERTQIAPNLADHTRFGDEMSARIRMMLDRYIEQAGIDAPPAAPDPAEAAGPDLPVPGPAALDLKAEGISSIIWCTGFGAGFSWLRVPQQFDERDEPVLREGISTTVEGLCFVGLPWQRTRKSGLICGVGEDAAHVVDAIRGTGT